MPGQVPRVVSTLVAPLTFNSLDVALRNHVYTEAIRQPRVNRAHGVLQLPRRLIHARFGR